jgi:type IV pilus assembly protein PilW
MSRSLSRRRAGGFTLIELMIGLLLGVLVIAAAAGIFLTNSRTREATDSLSRVQEGARVAFELIARDLRQAGSHSCGSFEMPVGNSLRNRDVGFAIAPQWWSTWGGGLRGYADGEAFSGSAGDPPTSGAVTARADGAAIEIKYASARDFDSAAQTGNPAQFTLNAPAATHGLVDGGLVMICSSIGPLGANPGQQDGPYATIAQAAVAGSVVSYIGGTGVPGNCAPTPRFNSTACNATSGAAYVFPIGSRVARYNAVRWYVGNNDRGGRSLFRQTITAGNSPAAVREEMIEGVTNLEFDYFQDGGTAFVAAGGVTNWAAVNAVRVTVQLQTGQGGVNAEGQRVSTDGDTLDRRFTNVVAIRSRLP